MNYQDAFEIIAVFIYVFYYHFRHQLIAYIFLSVSSRLSLMRTQQIPWQEASSVREMEFVCPCSQ